MVDVAKVRTFYRGPVAREWGIRVDQAMKTLNITEAELARRVGTTPQTISKVRTGKILPREYLRVMLAFSLMTEPGDLFPAPSRARVLEAIA